MAIPTLVPVVPQLEKFSPVIRYTESRVPANQDARWFNPSSGFVLVQPGGEDRYFVGKMNQSRIGGLYPLEDLHSGNVKVTGDGTLRYVEQAIANVTLRMGPFRMVDPKRDSRASMALRSARFMVQPADPEFISKH